MQSLGIRERVCELSNTIRRFVEKYALSCNTNAFFKIKRQIRKRQPTTRERYGRKTRKINEDETINELVHLQNACSFKSLKNQLIY
jgi:hypothetical protein